MRRLQSAIALLIAFSVAYMATPRESTKLEAQVGVPCDCTWLAGNVGDVDSTCLGRANMDSITCSQVGSLCSITGTAVWTPLSGGCVIGGSTNGWVRPISNATGSWSYVDPSTTAFTGWQINSADCSGSTFGAGMDVVHKDWTLSGSTCTCTPNTSSTSRVAVVLWTCDSI